MLVINITMPSRSDIEHIHERFDIGRCTYTLVATKLQNRSNHNKW
jgi:hypothetical protein